MPLPIITGSLLPFLQNESYHYSPTNGLTYHADFKGADRGLMEAFYQDWVNSACECELKYHQGGTATLDVIDSSRAIPSDIWEVKGDEENLDIFLNPNINFLTADQVGAVRALINQIETETISTTTGVTETIVTYIISNPTFDVLSGQQQLQLLNYIQLYLAGTTDFRDGLYTLHHTTNLPNSWNGSVNISDQNVGTVYSPAELQSEILNSAWWFPVCPNALITKITLAQTALLARFNNVTPYAYQMGWLKGTSTARMTAMNRISIDTDYTLNMWSIRPYGLYPFLA